MRGLINKDIFIFLKSFDKKVVLIILGCFAFIFYNLGIEGGTVTSMMLALFIGIQNTMNFVNDEKVRWNQYQLAMPVSNFTAVASKYIAVACTLGFSLLGSMVLNLLAGIAYGAFYPDIWVVSGIISVIVPLLWTGVSLPLIYWFGFQSARFLSIVLVVPLTYFINNFGDSKGFPVMADWIYSYALMTGIGAVILFGISMLISVAGYARRR